MGWSLKLFIEECLKNNWITEEEGESIADFMHPSIMGLIIKMYNRITLLKTENDLLKEDFNKQNEGMMKLSREFNSQNLRLHKIKEAFYDY